MAEFIVKNKYLTGLGANLLPLGIVSFLNDLSTEMIMPILPMFITVLGGAGLAVGLIGGLRDEGTNNSTITKRGARASKRND